MHASTDTDADLRYWLANEDWYMSRYTREWLERTPRDEAADTLAEIAENAVAEPRAPWAVMATIVASAGLATSDGIGGKGPGVRKAGTRAALILADFSDPRCVPPLVRVFSTGGFLQSKYQAQIETALTGFLSNTDLWPEIAVYESDVRTLAERLWQSGERHDFPPAHADLLIAALQFLHDTARSENTDLLRVIADSTPVNATRQPQRARVQQTVTALIS